MFNPQHSIKLGVGSHTCYSWIRVVETREPEGQGHPWLHKKLETSLGYISTCLQNIDFYEISSFHVSYHMLCGFILFNFLFWINNNRFQSCWKLIKTSCISFTHFPSIATPYRTLIYIKIKNGVINFYKPQSDLISSNLSSFVVIK